MASMLQAFLWRLLCHWFRVTQRTPLRLSSRTVSRGFSKTMCLSLGEHRRPTRKHRKIDERLRHRNRLLLTNILNEASWFDLCLGIYPVVTTELSTWQALCMRDITNSINGRKWTRYVTSCSRQAWIDGACWRYSGPGQRWGPSGILVIEQQIPPKMNFVFLLICLHASSTSYLKSEWVHPKSYGKEKLLINSKYIFPKRASMYPS